MWTFYLSIVICFILYSIFAWFKPGWGLGLLPLAIIVVVFVGAAHEDMFPIGFAIALFPLTVLVVRFTPSSSSLETPWYKSVTNVILTLFKYILILALFVVVFQFFSPILFILFIIGVVEFNKAKKYGLIIDTISAIGTSMRQSLPLPTALTAAAYGQKKKNARILNDIAHWLTQGQPLSEALKRGYPSCPSYIIASVSAAEKMDQLPEVIESLEADLAEKISRKMTSNSEHVLYPLVVLTAAFTIVMGLAVFVVPTFAEVLSDMSDGQAYLPTSTQSLLDISSWLMGRNGTNALLVFLLVVFIALFAMYVRYRRRSPEKPHLLSRIGDRIRWSVPLLHWFEKTLGNLHLVQTLRTGLLAGYPVNIVLRNALNLDINSCYRNQIKKWLNKMESGEDISQSARTCGLDKPVAWALDDKINKGNTPKILQGLEEVYRCKYNYRKNVLYAASEPIMILCLGLAVGFVVYSMFMGAFSILFVTLQYTIPQ